MNERCRIKGYADPSYATRWYCDRHQMPLPNDHPLGAMCPLGKIEEAAEQARIASGRKYSLEEIDRMREALLDLQPRTYYAITGGYAAISRPDMEFGEPSVEESLRTLMLNGTDPEELEAKVRARDEERMKQIAADVERETQRRTNAMLRKVFKPAEAR